MNRQQKESVVELLKKEFAQSDASFLVGVKGLTVSQIESLRKDLRQKGGKLKIAKARLMKLAAKDGDDAALSPFFKDQIGVVFAGKEVSSVAKALHDFSTNSTGALTVVAGCFENQLLGAQDVVRIASLPSREVILAQMCGTLKAPIAGFATILNLMVVRLLYVLKQIEERK